MSCQIKQEKILDAALFLGRVGEDTLNLSGLYFLQGKSLSQSTGFSSPFSSMRAWCSELLTAWRVLLRHSPCTIRIGIAVL